MGKRRGRGRGRNKQSGKRREVMVAGEEEGKGEEEEGIDKRKRVCGRARKIARRGNRRMHKKWNGGCWNRDKIGKKGDMRRDEVRGKAAKWPGCEGTRRGEQREKRGEVKRDSVWLASKQYQRTTKCRAL